MVWSQSQKGMEVLLEGDSGELGNDFTTGYPHREAKSVRIAWKVLAILTIVFFVGAVSMSCTRRPKPKMEPTEAPAPETKEEAPPVTAQKEPPSKAEEAPAPMEPAPSRMPEEPPAKSREGEGEAAAIEQLKDIHFEFDKYEVRPDARPILESNAGWLKENPQAKIQIEGHCDERGTVEYNLALGDRRAKSTRDYLISLGADPKQLSTISFGEERPQDPGHNEEAWAKNRRAHFVILK